MLITSAMEALEMAMSRFVHVLLCGKTIQISSTDEWNMNQVLAATQTPGEAGKNWFQGTADAVRQFHWLFEVSS